MREDMMKRLLSSFLPLDIDVWGQNAQSCDSYFNFVWLPVLYLWKVKNEGEYTHTYDEIAKNDGRTWILESIAQPPN